MQDPIVSVRVSTHALPLPRTLHFGEFVVKDRFYAVMHIKTRDGYVGCAYAQTRGAPVAALIEALFSGFLIGSNSVDVEDIWRRCFRATMGIGRTGLVVRALSLIDIALWDIRAQRAGQPVYKLFGGGDRAVPVAFIAGYPQTEEDIDDVATRAVDAVRQGHQTVKIAHSGSPPLTRQTLERLGCLLPASTKIVVDASWFWTDPSDAAREITSWGKHPIAWVEDPFAPEDTGAYADLRRRIDVPIGGGDEVSDPHAYDKLVAADGLDVLRLDVATIGGITPALRVLEKAVGWGLPVSMHVAPETSVHLAAAFSTIQGIETLPPGTPYDRSSELRTGGGPIYSNGTARPPISPGLGFTLLDVDTAALS